MSGGLHRYSEKCNNVSDFIYLFILLITTLLGSNDSFCYIQPVIFPLRDITVYICLHVYNCCSWVFGFFKKQSLFLVIPLQETKL